jgi:hypothetical protein
MQTGGSGTTTGVQEPAADAKKRHLTPGEILELFYRRPPWFYARKKRSLPRYLTVIISFIRSRPMRFLFAFMALNTILYATIYAGEYPLHLNHQVMEMLYVLFGSLLLSSLFFRQKPWKVVASTLGIISALAVIPLLGMPFLTEHAQSNISTFLFGTSFSPVDLFFYGLGAVIALFLLWALNSAEREECAVVHPPQKE